LPSNRLAACERDEFRRLQSPARDARPCPVRILGFPGFMPTGSPKFLFEKFGLTAEGIEKAAREAIALRAS
jgi:hypothetical protein